MSERTDDRDVLALLDRAAVHAPPLHLDRGSVVTRGRQIARRRRAGAGGMAIAGVALAGTVWLGLGGGSVLTAPEVAPASVSWEVDAPTTLTLLDDVGLGDERFTVTLTKEPGRASATFTVDGVQETVEGTTMRGGGDVFVGERGTLVVWEQPRGSWGSTLVPEPEDGFGTGGTVGEGDALFHLTTDVGYVPSDLVLHSDRAVWTAGGEVAATARLEDGSVEVTAFSLPGLGLGGYLEDGHPSPTFLDPSSVFVSGDVEPWWRGGEDLTVYLYRLPAEARWARPVIDSSASPPVVGAPVAATAVGDSAFAVSVLSRQEMVEAGVRGAFEWSSDGETWHATQDRPDASADDVGPVGQGGHVTLLGETYEVGVDAQGWPTLQRQDGSTFLTVTDEQGPSDGGVAMWRERWWPWSGRHAVHFHVGWQPPAGAELVVRGDGDWFAPQDVVTIAGPEGVVTLVSVPAEAGGPSVTGLGLRTDDGVTPVTPD